MYKKQLMALADSEYKAFSAKLIPTVDESCIIGVRMPQLRELTKKIKNDEDIGKFLCDLPHRYYEENNLHSLLISQIRDFDECINELDKFLPYVDNWATCDSTKPKSFKKNRDKLMIEIKRWLKSDRIYTVRFALNMLMTHFLDEDFRVEHLNMVSGVQSDEYYINMMIAWYFATALAKQWDYTFAYIKNNSLPIWVHNKTIQKAVESYRITTEQKELLRQLKRKE